MNAYQFAFTKHVDLEIGKGIKQSYSMAIVVEESLEKAIAVVRNYTAGANIIRSVTWINIEGMAVIPNGRNPFVVGDKNVEEGGSLGAGDSRPPERLVAGQAGGEPGVLADK